MAEPRIIRVEGELRERLEKFREEHEDDPIGGVATRVLHEDDQVKIWEMELAPGENSDLHHHERDYYLVMMQGDQVAGLPKSSDEEPIVIELPRGVTTMRIPKGATEWAVNVGKERFYEILIELKD